MKYLLWILGVIALLLVIVGVLNYGTDVSVDYVAGTTPSFSLFWVALVAAAALFVAAFLGWTAGRAGWGATRRKLEQELETTYRRLREAEARLPQPALTAADEPATTTLVVPGDGPATGAITALVGEPVPDAMALPVDDLETATMATSPDDAVTAVATPEEQTVTAERSLEPEDKTAEGSLESENAAVEASAPPEETSAAEVTPSEGSDRS